MTRHIASLTVLTALGLAACSDSPTTPVDGVQLSQDLTLEQFGGTLDTAEARVEIKLIPGTLIAREVELEQPEEMTHQESIRAHVTGISAAAGSGTLTLEIGGLEVGFDAATRLRGDDGDLSFDGFVAEIEAALAAGTEPFVRAKRPAPAEPQAPDDATFLATEVRIRNEADEPRLELNLDIDNLRLNDAPPPDAFLLVLGLEIEVRVSTGETEIEGDVDDRDENEFGGQVATVDVDAGSVTLANGTVVLVTAETRIEQHGDDGCDDGDDGNGGDDKKLGSLADVAAALAAGLPVEAEGEGSVQSTDPLTIVAREIEFEVEDEDEDDDDDDDDRPGQGAEFEAAVTAVDVAGGAVTLAGGRVVLVTASTVIDGDGDLLTLQAVSDAVAAGRPVRAEGRGAEDATGFVASSIEFEVDD
jgi:hypothetical protein